MLCSNLCCLGYMNISLLSSYLETNEVKRLYLSLLRYTVVNIFDLHIKSSIVMRIFNPAVENNTQDINIIN